MLHCWLNSGFCAALLLLRGIGTGMAHAPVFSLQTPSHPPGNRRTGKEGKLIYAQIEVQAETVNAALVSVGQTAATRNGRQLLATTPLVPLVADRALSSTGGVPPLQTMPCAMRGHRFLA